MPKYKNTKTFSQPIVITGKRYIIKPGEVFTNPAELNLTIYSFLEKVADNTPISKVQEVTLKSVAKQSDVTQLKNTVEEVKIQLKSAQSSSKDIETLSQKVDAVLKRLDIMKDAVEKTNVYIDDVAKMAKETSEAVHVLEKEVYENGTFAIIDDELDKETK